MKHTLTEEPENTAGQVRAIVKDSATGKLISTSAMANRPNKRSIEKKRTPIADQPSELLAKVREMRTRVAALRKESLTYKDMLAGIPASTISETIGKGLTRDDIRTVIPDRTLERRIADGAPLKIEEADGIARLARVLDHARRAFGDERLADLWLRNPNPALEDRVPIHMARTDLGGREVEAVLYRIEHGVFS